VATPLPTTSSVEDQPPSTSRNTFTGLGVVGSLTKALGLSRDKQPETVIAENESSQAQREVASEVSPAQPPTLKDTSGSVGIRKKSLEKPGESAVPIAATNQASQTLLTAEQIDDALKKSAIQASPNSGLSKNSALKPIITGVMPRPASRSRALIVDSDLPSPSSPVKRPGSSTSLQGTNSVADASTSAGTGTISIAAQHPPLPADHRTVIAKAGGRLSTSTAEASQPATTSSAGAMGPPVAPASAYRRPRTSVDHSISSPTRGNITSRQVYRDRDRPRTGSQISRRSSISSFASELDERFNIRTDGAPTNQTFDSGPGTDPRMIQAITQTMIGEFLWKYTRKAGRPEMSNTRHERYFWIHPYTRTLYWSEQDPQAAGGKELKAKSVAIESVRVVSDDNPLPLGLHRKSLEVVTPGRKVRFTAGTESRHETWFNALSYLLMRAQDDGMKPDNATTMDAGGGGGSGLTTEDVNEFNPSGYSRNSRINGPSRASLSSYNSHTTRGTTTHRASTRQSGAQPGLASVSATTPTLTTSEQRARYRERDDDPNRTLRQSSVSRISHLFKHPASIRHSFSMSRRSLRDADLAAAGTTTGTGTVGAGAARGHESGIYDASVVSEGGAESAEELRREMVRQAGGGKLENVRACCDGEFSFFFFFFFFFFSFPPL
jgi:Meiotic cell cortex C-terminal pleckstrin homology